MFDDKTLKGFLDVLEALRSAKDGAGSWDAGLGRVGDELTKLEELGVSAAPVRELYAALEKWQASAVGALGLMQIRLLRLLQDGGAVGGAGGAADGGGDPSGVREPRVPVAPTGGASRQAEPERVGVLPRGFLIDENPDG